MPLELIRSDRSPAAASLHPAVTRRRFPPWRSAADDLARRLTEVLTDALAQGIPVVEVPLKRMARGMPLQEAAATATQTVRDFLCRCVPDNDLTVRLLLPPPDGHAAERHHGLRRFVESRCGEAFPSEELLRTSCTVCEAPREVFSDVLCAPGARADLLEHFPAPLSLEDELNRLDESFAQQLQRLISERGMKSADCYRRANVDRKLFSKIINTPDYRPRKTTVLALAVALELSLEETRSLLLSAGLALSRSHKLDVIVEYFIRHGEYDVFVINEALYAFDQPLLGGVSA